MWTDPPYGVSYTGRTKNKLTIRGDTAATLPALLQGAFSAAHEALAPGAAIYVAHPAGRGAVLFEEQFLARGWRLHQTLIWPTSSSITSASSTPPSVPVFSRVWPRSPARSLSLADLVRRE